jgi:hypothetical protein
LQHTAARRQGTSQRMDMSRCVVHAVAQHENVQDAGSARRLICCSTSLIMSALPAARCVMHAVAQNKTTSRLSGGAGCAQSPMYSSAGLVLTASAAAQTGVIRTHAKQPAPGQHLGAVSSSPAERCLQACRTAFALISTWCCQQSQQLLHPHAHAPAPVLCRT